MGLRKYVEWLLSSSGKLSQRVIRSGMWSVALNSSNRILQLTKTVILARLLVPEDFGIVGIAAVLLVTGQKIADVGFNEALIQREETNVDEYIDTTWTVRAIQGVVVTLVLYLMAPLAGAVFSEPRLVPVVRVLALAATMKGLVNPAIIYFRKDLEFQGEFVYQVSGTLANVVVGIGAAVQFGNLWALVFAIIAGEAVQLVVSFLITDYRPLPEFEISKAKQLFEFSRWVYASRLVLFTIQNGDDLFVGWLLGTNALGFYRVAFRFGNAPATEIANVVSGVTFPAYAKLQNDSKRLATAFQKTLEVILLTSLPAAVGLILIAESFTSVLLGAKWLPMVPLFQVIAIAGLLRGLVESGRPLFQGVGAPEWDFRMNLVRLVVVAITIWPLSEQFGATGTAISITLGMAATVPIWFFETSRITGISPRHYIRTAVVPTGAAVLMVPSVIAVVEPSVGGLVTGIGTGTVVYTSVAYAGYRVSGRQPVKEIRSLIQ